jgi:hypothetical protein
MSFKEVKSDPTGARKTFETGAVRDTGGGKGRFDLIPSYPILRLAQHYENGAVKYSDRNWEKGIPLHCFMNSAEHHINLFKEGDRSEDHLAAVLWNIAGYLWTEKEIREGRLPQALWTVPWGDSTGKVQIKLVPPPGLKVVFLPEQDKLYTICLTCARPIWPAPNHCTCSGAV